MTDELWCQPNYGSRHYTKLKRKYFPATKTTDINRENLYDVGAKRQQLLMLLRLRLLCRSLVWFGLLQAVQVGDDAGVTGINGKKPLKQNTIRHQQW